MATDPDHHGFEPSQLGTLHFWDVSYERELQTFNQIGHEGETWFGDQCSYEILRWIQHHLPPAHQQTTHQDISDHRAPDGHSSVDRRQEPLILDVGCGNGQLLFLLVQGGYPVASLTGLDYSAVSIELATQIATSKGITHLKLEVSDLIKDPIQPPITFEHGREYRGWDLITDKGTFDAICLSEETIQGRKLSSLYPSRIVNLLLKPRGIFLITSCNWTEDELISRFTQPGIGLQLHSKIPRPVMTFGGGRGSTIATVAFQATQKD